MSGFEIMVAAAGPAIAGLCAVLFALWIKRAMEGRMDALEEGLKMKGDDKDVDEITATMKDKVDGALCNEKHKGLNDKLTSMEKFLGGFMSDVKTALTDGNKVMSGLAADMAAVKESIKPKGG